MDAHHQSLNYIEHGGIHPAMLDFRPVEPADAQRLSAFLPHFREMLCDFTLGSLLLWRDQYRNAVALEDGRLYLRQYFQSGDITAFAYPQGPEPLRHEGVNRLLAHCRACGARPLLCNVSAGELETLRSRFVLKDVRAERDWFDYLYDAPAFAEMAGRRYAGQRNHIHKFLRAFPDWRYEPLGPDNSAAAAAFLETCYPEGDALSGMLRQEREKLREALPCLERYGMFGGVLFGGGKTLALAAGERVGPTLFVHNEKADFRAPGAHQMMAREFVRRNAGDALYVNREEDMGIEGLRVSKMSYHPLRLLEKYTVEIES